MCHSAGMDVEFSRPPTLRTALNALFAGGWSPVIEGKIQFLQPGTFSRTDWVKQPESCWPMILEILEENTTEGNVNRLLMRFKDTLYDAVFEFFKGGDITVDCGPVRPRLQNCSNFTDTNWLISHVAVPLADAGAIIDKVRFSEIRLADGLTDHY